MMSINYQEISVRKFQSIKLMLNVSKKYFNFWHIHYGFLYRVEHSFRLTKIAFCRSIN